MNDKRKLREQIYQHSKSLTPVLHHTMQSYVYEHLFASDMWKKSDRVAVTLSTGREIDTMPLIEKAWEEQKQIAVPKVDPMQRSLHFYSMDSMHELEEGFAGIMEPQTHNKQEWDKNKFDMVIVPGMVFDREGYRIGFGGGYYDRFLEDCRACTCSLAFSYQLIERVPREAHDIPVQAVVTEEGVIYI
ncbi:5-formyltetrahydrofolate cyclo-ligase [Sinobaca qinghaiensis]|uniref:5-formyltetrahydrofolate cyclo-ligase n=1 Tax=Sinobaca qinghaiensis TaxID=342944 RepID=A0A419V3C2_9BACL|nr:5-formyltetrahydrofolate cyclo-ligase [Sinobaca qinghaiensis]RKD72998.1 5-formyltetrahydrofolate cyclo-ligase [Sinobaca qinghaiensis]